MKKALALAALIIGSAVVIFVLAVLNLILFFLVYGVVVLIGIAAAVGLGFALAALQGVFERKMGLSWKRFILCAYVPSAAVSAVYLIVVLILDKMGYFKGFLGGVGEFITGLAWSITSAAALIAGLTILVSKWERKGQL